MPSLKRAIIEAGVWFAVAVGVAVYVKHSGMGSTWHDAALVITGVALAMCTYFIAVVTQILEDRKKARKVKGPDA